MKRIFFLSAFLFSVFCFPLQGQEEVCAAHKLLEKNIEENPGLADYIDQYLTELARLIRDNPYNPTLHRSPVTIPVVVHVVHKRNVSAERIAANKIIDQIRGINKDFAKRNSDFSSVPDEFKRKAANCYLQFELAKRKPNGTATNGIEYYPTDEPYFLYEDESVKDASEGGADPWDTDKYLNIWVADIRHYDDDGTTVLDNLNGYGTFPEDEDAIHGVAMDFTQFGTGSGNTYQTDRTWCHEIGHFFGLRHIWGDVIGCGGSDLVDDTPNQERNSRGCPTHPRNTCSSNDMHMNIMDYSSDRCRLMFTLGQRKRMLANLAPGKARASLAASDALIPPGAEQINREVLLMPAMEGFPSWKAAVAMVWGYWFQQSPDIDGLVADINTSPDSEVLFGAIPRDISEVIYALGQHVEALEVCYSAAGFYDLLSENGGPVAFLALEDAEAYGLVVSGMSFDASSGAAQLIIQDPKNIGPSLGLDQSGATYTVDYNRFMVENVEAMVAAGRTVYLVYM